MNTRLRPFLVGLAAATMLVSMPAFADDDAVSEDSIPAADKPTKTPGAVKPKTPDDTPPPAVKAGPTDGRVLPPKSNVLLEAAFGRMAPELVLDNAKIEKTSVTAKVCTADKSACFELTLTDPKRDCKGKVVGAWCLTWKAAPDDIMVAKAESALGSDSDEKVWAVAAHKPLAGNKPGVGPPGNMPSPATLVEHLGQAPREMPQAEMSDPSLLLLLAAAFGVLIAAIALFRMRGDGDSGDGEG